MLRTSQANKTRLKLDHKSSTALRNTSLPNQTDRTYRTPVRIRPLQLLHRRDSPRPRCEQAKPTKPDLGARIFRRTTFQQGGFVIEIVLGSKICKEFINSPSYTSHFRLLVVTMRLLHTKKFELHVFGGREVPGYAILSHTWGDEEVTLQDIKTNEAVKLRGYEKVSNACLVAAADGFDYVWIDTCCIDKTSSAELSEALNSMYRWYQEAEECYAYLADVPHNSVNRVTGVTGPEFQKSRWFTRGWTLQELIAPLSVIFLDSEWQEIGTKSNLQRDISEITGIPGNFLLGDDLRHASVAQRMSWASKRETTRTEDLAYCLMGLFGIYMPMLYGEGERAFIRLQEEIMRVSDDHSLFAWRSIEDHGGILAISPAAFANSGNIIPVSPAYATSSPSTLSSRGIHLSLHFIKNGQQGEGLAILHCTEIGRERMRLALHLRDVFLTNEDFVREQSTTLELIDMEGINPSQHPLTSLYVRQWHPTRNRNWEGMEKCVVKLAGIDAQEAASRIANLDSNCDLSDGLLIMNMKAISDGLLGQLVVVCKDGNLFQVLLSKHGRSLSADISASTTDLQHIQDLNILEKEQKDQDRIVKVLSDGQHVHIAIKKRVLLLRGERCLTGVVEISYSSTLKGIWLEHAAILEKGIKEKTLLSYAAKRGLTTVLEHLLDREGIESKSKDDLRTPLSWAAEGGQEEVVKRLLVRGAALDSKDKDGRVPFSWAAGSGHEAIVRLLLAKAAALEEIEKEIGDRKPLSRAGWQRLLPTKATKVESKRNDGPVRHYWLISEDEYSRTPLFYAAQNGNEAVIKLLLDKGFDVNAASLSGSTPLHQASENGHVEVVKLLLEKGAH
ncbi:ankyrin, partial [Acephala macrosclerotiorum]